MPIEIMELRVKASVCGESQQPAVPRDARTPAVSAAANNTAVRQNEQEVIIQQAVEQVLAILRQEKER